MSEVITDQGLDGANQNSSLLESNLIINILTSKLFLFNCLFSFLWILFAKKNIKPLFPKNEEDNKRDKKYEPFKRNDLEYLSKSWKFYLWSPTGLARLIIPYSSIAVMCLVTYILSFFKKSNNNFNGISFRIIRGFQIFTGYATLIASGIPRMKVINLEVDYSDYLGPDWKPSQLKDKKATAIVSNHISWLDIMVNMIS